MAYVELDKIEKTDENYGKLLIEYTRRTGEDWPHMTVEYPIKNRGTVWGFIGSKGCVLALDPLK